MGPAERRKSERRSFGWGGDAVSQDDPRKANPSRQSTSRVVPPWLLRATIRALFPLQASRRDPPIDGRTEASRIDRDLTFLVPHHNGPEFLGAALHSIRKHHPGSRISVSDAGSTSVHLRAASSACRTYGAELQPLVRRRRHTAQLDHLIRRARTPYAVIVDQDCLLLRRLDEILCELTEDCWLIGPQDRMALDNPELRRRQPGVNWSYLRDAPRYVHASFMVLRPRPILERFGTKPFTWDPSLGPRPREKYYGLCERLHRDDRRRIGMLQSAHTRYGFGMAYLFDGRPIAYHQWYSGRTSDAGETIDGTDTRFLEEALRRFLEDYWAGRVDLGLTDLSETSDSGAEPGPGIVA